MSSVQDELAERLFALLPAVYRVRDAEQGGVLRELVEVLADQVAVLDGEIGQLYEDQFVETCAEWVAPYLGDLIGYRPLHGDVPAVASPRAEVANTIGYRRRKGTAAVLEQLARDVTGWPARAVEFFERLATTQYANHLRPHARATVDFRDSEALGWLTTQNAAFDDLAHSADVRRIGATPPAGRGRHNIANVGIFLWRIEAVRRTRSPLVDAGDGVRFRFDALGTDTPLFGAPRSEPEITHLAEPRDVPLPLARRWSADHLGECYGRGGSLLVEVAAPGGDAEPIELGRIRVCDLSDTGASWAHQPSGTDVAIDPVLGRLWLGTALAAGERLVATFHHGVAVPVGAGTSGRSPTDEPVPERASGGEALQPHVDAVASGGTLVIEDCERYAGSLSVAAATAPPTSPDTVVVVAAADEVMPLVDVSGGTLRLAPEPRTTVVLDGLLVLGGPVVLDEVGDGEPRTVILRGCTLVPGQRRTSDGRPVTPGRASLIVLDPFAEVHVERCVLGPVVAVECATVRVVDSAVDATSPDGVAFCGRAAPGGTLRTVQLVADHEVGDGTEPGGLLDLHETTVIGGIHATQIDASNSLLVARLPTGDPRLAAVHAERRQVGCVRYSYVPAGSRTGRRFHCQPSPKDPPSVQADANPRFSSLRFGDPAYLQLAATTPDGLRRGADDEGEMGATHLLFAPQRESNLLLRLDEHLRYGLEAGFFYAT